MVYTRTAQQKHSVSVWSARSRTRGGARCPSPPCLHPSRGAAKPPPCGPHWQHLSMASTRPAQQKHSVSVWSARSRTRSGARRPSYTLYVVLSVVFAQLVVRGLESWVSGLAFFLTLLTYHTNLVPSNTNHPSSRPDPRPYPLPGPPARTSRGARWCYLCCASHTRTAPRRGFSLQAQTSARPPCPEPVLPPLWRYCLCGAKGCKIKSEHHLFVSSNFTPCSARTSARPPCPDLCPDFAGRMRCYPCSAVE